MRSLLPAALAAVLATAACTQAPDEPAALPPVHVVEMPAASAGGACVLWDYEFIEEMIGVRFSIAAGTRVDNTATCLVRNQDSAVPSLLLTVTPTTADPELFADAMPSKAKKLKGLGKAGYRTIAKSSGRSGPAIELAWLSEAKQLQSLRFTFAKGAQQDAVDDMAGNLLDLARAMDTVEGKPAKKNDKKA